MKTLEIEEARGALSSYARLVRKEPVVVVDRGRPVMALVSMRNIDIETASLSTDPRFIALIERSRALYKPGTGIPLETMRTRFERLRRPKHNAVRRATHKRR